MRRVDNDGKLVWTYMVGDTHSNSRKMSYSAGYSIIQVQYKFACMNCTSHISISPGTNFLLEVDFGRKTKM